MTRRPLSIVCLVMILVLFLNTTQNNTSPPFFLEWEGKTVIAVGEVFKKETVTSGQKDSQIVYLRLHSVSYGKQTVDVSGEDYRTICYLQENQTLPQIGSIIQASGRMKCFTKATNPGQFDAESYYQTLKIIFQLNQTEIQAKSDTYRKWEEKLYQYRSNFSAVFDKLLSKEDASVMKTMLLGEKKAADEERKELYQRNGIAHILAVSALHVSLLGMTLFRVLRKVGVPVFACAGASFIFVFLYGCMTGNSVSTVRAVGMFGLQMLAIILGRSYDIVTATAVMALILLWNEPLYFYSSSFIYSFGCVSAIGLLIPALTKKRLKKEKEPSPLLSKVMPGAVISIATLPIQLWFFYRIPVYSVFLNLIVIPLMSFLLPAGILLLLSEWLCVFVKSVFGRPIVIGFIQKLIINLISGILYVYDLLCGTVEGFPFAHLCVGQPKVWKMVLYFCVLLGIVIMQRKISLKKKWLLVSAAVVMLLWPARPEFAITFLDVGQGDCIHIESEEGNHYLIDGGSSSVSDVGEYRILPYLNSIGVNELSAVFVTHADEDHCNGILELLAMEEKEGILVKKLYLPDVGDAARTEGYQTVEKAAFEAGIDVGYFSKGMCLKDGELELICLHPEKGIVTESENAYSLVFLLEYGQFRALLTGDVEGEGEEDLIKVLAGVQELDVTVLKVAHHGSKYSTGTDFLQLVNPEIAVISCGENNSYGHPHEETLKRLADAGSKIFSTPECGAITVHVSDNTCYVEAYREVKEAYP